MVIGSGALGVLFSGLDVVCIPYVGSSETGTSSVHTPNGLVIQLFHRVSSSCMKFM